MWRCSYGPPAPDRGPVGNCLEAGCLTVAFLVVWSVWLGAIAIIVEVVRRVVPL